MTIQARSKEIIQDNQLREHLIMMLTALGYVGGVTKMNNDQLRDEVERAKFIFLRRLQEAPL